MKCGAQRLKWTCITGLGKHSKTLWPYLVMGNSIHDVLRTKFNTGRHAVTLLSNLWIIAEKNARSYAYRNGKLNIVCFKSLFWARKVNLKSLVSHVQQNCVLTAITSQIQKLANSKCRTFRKFMWTYKTKGIVLASYSFVILWQTNTITSDFPYIPTVVFFNLYVWSKFVSCVTVMMLWRKVDN